MFFKSAIIILLHNTDVHPDWTLFCD